MHAQRAVYWHTAMFTGGKLPLVLGQDSPAGREARWKLVVSQLGAAALAALPAAYLGMLKLRASSAPAL